MKQRSVGVHAIKMIVRKIELEEILLPYFAATMSARHHGEMSGTLQTDSYVTEFRKHLEVAAGAAAKIEYRKWRFTHDPLSRSRARGTAGSPAASCCRSDRVRPQTAPETGPHRPGDKCAHQSSSRRGH